MKIAVIARYLPGESKGGAGFQAHNLANRLAARGHQVVIFSCRAKPAGAFYEHVRIPLARIRHAASAEAFLFPVYVAEQDYTSFDVIHAHGDNHFLADPPAPLVRTFYGSALWESLAASDPADRMLKLALYPLEWLGGLRASRTVAISEHTRSCFPFIDLIIPCGVDLDVFHPGGEKAPDPTILFVGMLEGRKRGRFLQDVFEREVRPLLPRAQLWLVCGREYSSPGVRAFGYVPEQQLAELYRQAWVFCLPSIYEGFGVPYIEAMASGTPVVATPNPGALEVLDEGRYGLLVPDEKLGRTLGELLQDQERRQFYAQRGLERCRIYSWERVVSAYEELFQEISRSGGD